MNDAKHTPGPFGKWESIDDKQFSERFESSKGFFPMEENEVAIIELDKDDFPHFIATVHDGTPGKNHGRSARLIAAAPDLKEVAVQSLRAMQTARKQLEPGTLGFDVLTTAIDEARAALRKAGIVEPGN